MHVRVIEPPEPIVTPSQVSPAYADEDASIQALIAAATEELDGPTGWLGRCLGPQTLELVGRSFYAMGNPYGIPLPCPPIIDIVSVKYLDAAGSEQTVDPGVYRPAYGHIALQPGRNWPGFGCFADAVRIRYRAGYDGETTGPVPERARQAIIMAVQHMKAIGAENLFLRSEEVEGIGSRQYTVSDQAGAVIRKAAKQLLSGLKVPRV